MSRDISNVTWYNSGMKIYDQSNVSSEFYQPLEDALERSNSKRDCRDYSDSISLRAGVGRIIDAAQSGRAWVQRIGMLGIATVSVRNFFQALSSKRRLRLLLEIDQDLREQVNQQLKTYGDPFDQIPELDGFELYASDGHCHGASAHEDKIGGKKRPVNHIYSLNLRSNALSHFALTEPGKGKKKEHEIAAIKRYGGPALRYNAPKGTKVIHAYDPAVIDYNEWYKWKQGSGVYIVTCEKLEAIGVGPH